MVASSSFAKGGIKIIRKAENEYACTGSGVQIGEVGWSGGDYAVGRGVCEGPDGSMIIGRYDAMSADAARLAERGGMNSSGKDRVPGIRTSLC